MGNIIIVKPFDLTYNSTAPTVVASRGTTPQNIITADPKEVLVDATTGSALNLDIDLGVATDWDTIALVGVNVVNDTYTISGGATYTTTTYFATGAQFQAGAPSPAISLFRNASVINGRFIRVALTRTTSIGTMQIGRLIVGKAFEPTYNQEWGAGRQILDTGAKEALLGGGFGIGEGARKAGYRWTLGDLTDADLALLYELALDRGETRPVLVCEDPGSASGLARRLHYGLFDKFEAYERANPQQTRWSLSMSEWT